MGEAERNYLNDLIASGLKQSPITLDIIRAVLDKKTQYALAGMNKGSIEIFIKDKRFYKAIVHTDLMRGKEIPN